MKLYASVTSERATKGQGGNDYLDIDIFVGSTENSIPLAKFTARYTDELPDGGSGYALYDENDEIIKWIEDKKGNKQKGECSKHLPNECTVNCIHRK